MEADGWRWTLLVIGSLVIIGLAVHGIWLSRKNSEQKETTTKRKKDQEFQPSGWQSEQEDLDPAITHLNDQIVGDSDIKFDIDFDDDNKVKASTTETHGQFDDLGIGAVRVVSSEVTVNDDEYPNTDSSIDSTDKLPANDLQANTELNVETEVPTSKIYASVVTQPKPEYAAKYTSLAAETVAITQQERASSNGMDAPNNVSDSAKVEVKVDNSQGIHATTNAFSTNGNYQAPEPPPFLLKKEATDTNEPPSAAVKQTKQSEAAEQKYDVEKPHATLAEKLSLTEQARNLVKGKKSESARKRREPKIADDQMRIDFDDQPTVESPAGPDAQAKSPIEEQPQEVLVLNVKSADDNPIPGSALLPMLLTLGFKFGDQDIFHRHVNSNGKGPVLFSLANMFKPGNFDIDNLENFTTQGISLFMILPIEGDPHQVFNMMHNAARKIAEEFSAQIYDGKRTLLTKQSLQQYVEKIREFERQRLLRG